MVLSALLTLSEQVSYASMRTGDFQGLKLDENCGVRVALVLVCVSDF